MVCEVKGGDFWGDNCYQLVVFFNRTVFEHEVTYSMKGKKSKVGTILKVARQIPLTDPQTVELHLATPVQMFVLIPSDALEIKGGLKENQYVKLTMSMVLSSVRKTEEGDVVITPVPVPFKC